MRPFNSDFYVTSATVIPVLYLALTLQGRTFHDLMTRWRSANRDAPFKLWPQVVVVALAIASAFAAWVVIESIFAEYQALTDLYNGHAAALDKRNILNSDKWLLVLVAAGPMLLFFTTVFGAIRDDHNAAMNGRLGVIVLARRIRRALGPSASAMPTWPPWRRPDGKPPKRR